MGVVAVAVAALGAFFAALLWPAEPVPGRASAPLPPAVQEPAPVAVASPGKSASDSATPTPELPLGAPGPVDCLELTVTLPPGGYEYKFHFHPDHWLTDPANPEYATNGQFRNSFFRVPGGAVDANGKRSPWPKVNDATGEVTFRYPKPRGVTAAFVSGSFNKWTDDEKFRMLPCP